MRYLFVINTPAQFYFWKNAIFHFINEGQSVQIIARDYGATCQLLDNSNLKYFVYVKPNSGKMRRGFQGILHVVNAYRLARRFNPDIIMGFGIVESIVSALIRKPSIIFTDDEPIPVQSYVTKLCAGAVITPACFTKDLGEKHVRVEGYKELAYLHPNYFKPDPAILKELGVDIDEKYVIIRLNVFDAVHDIGKHGFTLANQVELVKELGKYARVFISPEGNLSKELEAFRLPIAANRIHHALYYCQLLVTDTHTMATEAAILGTPSVRSNNFVGSNDMGVFIELEKKYDIVYSLLQPEQAINKAIELIKQPDLKEQWGKKRERLMADKIDVGKFISDFIENYPESLRKIQGKKI